MALEIERKFLINHSLENLHSQEDLYSRYCEEILQGYLPFFENKKDIRIRKKGGKYYLAVKIKIEEGIRNETEIELSKNQFDALWPLTGGARLLKHRYWIPYNGRLIELDIYREELDGLIIAEVEFDSKESSKNFVPPDWFGKDITKDKKYKNRHLAIYGLPPDFTSENISKIPEYDLENGLAKLYQLTREKLEENNDPIFVFIAGGSASGKTSAVSVKLISMFHVDTHILLVSMDDYYRGAKFIKEQVEKGININWDQIEAINTELLREHFERLRRGEPIEKPIYSFKTGEPEGAQTLYPRRRQIIIFDGLFLLDDSLADFANISVFVDVGFHGRILRRLFRDVHRTGQKSAEILKYFSEVVEPMHEKFIEPTKKNADLIIKNEYNPKIEAKTSGLSEIQLKFKLSKEDEESLTKRLKELDVKKGEFKFQMDYYYNPHDRDLAATGEVLRIRKEDGRTILAYKGPLLDSDFRKRPKLEFEIDQEAEERFLALYGGMVKIIEKTRKFYFLNGIVFCIDNVKKIEGMKRIDLGKFLEIQSTNKEASEEPLKAALLRLGLPLEKSTTQSYFEM